MRHGRGEYEIEPGEDQIAMKGNVKFWVNVRLRLKLVRMEMTSLVEDEEEGPIHLLTRINLLECSKD